MTKIQTDLPPEVFYALAKVFGFNVMYDRTPGVDKWTLSAGHSQTHRQFEGTRAEVCAFLNGYSEMHMIAVQILNELETAQHNLIANMKVRL